MASTVNRFTQLLITYQEVRRENPDWSDAMVEDYMSLKRDLIFTADETDQNADQDADNAVAALLFQTRQQIGSGNPLTSDETGFTVDTIKLSVDMDES